MLYIVYSSVLESLSDNNYYKDSNMHVYNSHTCNYENLFPFRY